MRGNDTTPLFRLTIVKLLRSKPWASLTATLLVMEAFESELAKATRPANGELLGAIAMVIDNKGE